MSRQELESAANSLWRNQQMSSQSVASALLDLIVRYANSPDEDFEKQYSELRDALCSPAWMGRNRHASVVALAKRLHDSQLQLRPLELEDVALAAGYCIRASGHDGPCNGLPRNDCYARRSE